MMRLRRPFVALVVTFILATMAMAALAPPAHGAVPGHPASAQPCGNWVRLIDVSQYQPFTDWSRVARADYVSGAYIKSSEGRSWQDPLWGRNVVDTTAAGFPWGGYHFARPSWNDAVAEADFVHSIGGDKGTLPPMLDLEANDYGLSGDQIDQWSIDYQHEIERLSGRTPIIYRGAYFTGGNNGDLAVMALMVPNYPEGYRADPNPCAHGWPPISPAWSGPGLTIWQYTSSAHIPGVGGSSVDESIAAPEWWTRVTGAGTTPDPSGDPEQPAQAIWGPGSHGPKVAQIQQIVGVRVDGDYGPVTKAAVIRWQRFLGVPADGYWGPATEDATAALFDALAGLGDTNPPAPEPPSPPQHVSVIRRGAHGQDVCDLQDELNQRVLPPLSIDCSFGGATDANVRAYQGGHGLNPDGIVGPATWATLDGDIGA